VLIDQDEQKRIEDSEKASREDLSDRYEAIYWELEDFSNRRENTQNQKQNVEIDELYASLPTRSLLLASS